MDRKWTARFGEGRVRRNLAGGDSRTTEERCERARFDFLSFALEIQ